MARVPELLNETIRELHALHEHDPDQHAQFAALLRSAVAHVSSLLGLVGKDTHHLSLSTALGTLELVYYASPVVVAHEDFTYANIFLFIKDDAVLHDSPSALFTHLLELLTEAHADRRPARVKLSYSHIISRFSELVLFFLRRYRDAEAALVDYVARCFLYEYSYFSKLQSLLDDGNSPHKNTHDIVLALDHFIQGTELPSELDLMFSYEPAEKPLEALNFQSSDANFTRLYHIFLQLSLFKSPNTFHENAVAYIRVMLNFYKRSYHIDHMELDDFETAEARLELLYAFFVGSAHAEGIVPKELRSVASEVLDGVLEVPEFSKHNEQTRVQIEDSLPLQLPSNYQEYDLEELILNLSTVISMLKEHDLDFDAGFPLLFRHYLHLVYDVLPECAVKEDFEYIDILGSTIQAIADFDNEGDGVEGEQIQNIVVRLHHLQETLSVVLSSLTMLMRAAMKENSYIADLKRRVWREWNYRTCAILNLNVVCDDELVMQNQKLTKKIVSLWFSKTLRFADLARSASKYSNKKLLAKHFNVFWIQKLVDLEKAEVEWRNSQMKSIVLIWKEKVAHFRSLKAKLSKSYDKACVKYAFSTFSRKYDDLCALELSAVALASSFEARKLRLVLQNTLALWRKQLEKKYFENNSNFAEMSQKLSKLDEVLRSHVLRKLFTEWSIKSRLHTLQKKAQNMREYSLKRRFFNVWIEREKLQSLGAEFQEESERKLQLAIFRHWRETTQLHEKANGFYKVHLLSKFLRDWRLAHVDSNFQKEFDLKKVESYFIAWRFASRKAILAEQCEGNLLRRVFAVWTLKQATINGNIREAERFYDDNVENRTLSNWISTLAVHEEMIFVADLNIQRKFLKKLQSAHSRVQECQMLAEERLLAKGNFDEKFILKQILVKWKEHYFQRFDIKSEVMVKQFLTEILNVGKKKVFFEFWRRKANAIKNKQLQLRKRAELFEKTSPITSDTFYNWLTRFDEQREAARRSLEFQTTLWQKKALLAWYAKYHAKVESLSDMADEFANQKDYLRLVKFLRKWSLNYVKVVKRNQQTYELFMENLKGSRMRTFFELWLHKLRLTTVQQDVYAEANTSFGSNASPLARKSERPNHGESALDMPSYIHTPIKKQVGFSPFTPRPSKGPSPTKLQETNQKMRLDRINASISRYRDAKGKNGRGAVLQEETRPRLPPPVRSPVRPPPAPRFGSYSSRSLPEATSSPTLISASVSFVDSSLIDTAKKLQKIKPIVIPQEDEITPGLRYSSPRRLKERLRRREESPTG